MTTKLRPRILIIYTGGTIGMIENASTHALQPFDFSHLIDNVPKVKKLGYDIDNIQFNPPIDSANMSPKHWSEIAQAIEKNYDSYDGFVVLHGTDTMAFTASALSFMLENLRKPVIITGSQLPIGEVRTDGEESGCRHRRQGRCHGAGSGYFVQQLTMAWQSQHQDERRQLQRVQEQ